MNNGRRSEDKVSPYLVLELAYQRDRKGDSIVLYASKAGTDDVGAYEWPLGFGVLGAGQMEDIVAKVGELATLASVLWVGVQGELGAESTR